MITGSEDSLAESPGEYEESVSGALRLVVRLEQPFGAAAWRYKRMVADHKIVAQAEDAASVRSMIDVRTIEILYLDSFRTTELLSLMRVYS